MARHAKSMAEKVYKRRVDQVQELLKCQEMTSRELAAGMAWSHKHTLYFIRQLRADRMIHIDDWVNDHGGRPIVPLFRWGKGEDAPRPGRKPQVYQKRPRRDRLAWVKTEEKQCNSGATETSVKAASNFSTARRRSTSTARASLG